MRLRTQAARIRISTALGGRWGARLEPMNRSRQPWPYAMARANLVPSRPGLVDLAEEFESLWMSMGPVSNAIAFVRTSPRADANSMRRTLVHRNRHGLEKYSVGIGACFLARTLPKSSKPRERRAPSLSCSRTPCD